MFAKPASLQAFTASMVCWLVCRRPISCRVSSLNVWVPMLMRLTGVPLSPSSHSLVTSSGLASMVTSALSSSIHERPIASKSLWSRSVGKRLGVPPPIYIVCTREVSR